MRRVLALLVAVLAVSPAFAQAKKTSTPNAADDGEKVVKLDEQLASIVDADKANCDKMAADLNSFLAKNGDEMHRLRAEGAKRNPEQRSAFMKKYGARIQAATAKMNAGIGHCIQNPKVKAALAGMK